LLVSRFNSYQIPSETHLRICDLAGRWMQHTAYSILRGECMLFSATVAWAIFREGKKKTALVSDD
jgi:hypothetical protein